MTEFDQITELMRLRRIPSFRYSAQAVRLFVRDGIRGPSQAQDDGRFFRTLALVAVRHLWGAHHFFRVGEEEGYWRFAPCLPQAVSPAAAGSAFDFSQSLKAPSLHSG